MYLHGTLKYRNLQIVIGLVCWEKEEKKDLTKSCSMSLMQGVK